jgi:hypothetical protein
MFRAIACVAVLIGLLVAVAWDRRLPTAGQTAIPGVVAAGAR